MEKLKSCLIREGSCVKREATNNVNEPLTLHPSPLTNVAFTMAEILLSLTIIGVVAAITLPSLTGNINERTWNTQRKALYSRISQAIALMPALNGYGQVREESSEGAGDAVDTAAETFVTSGLSKVLKINNICSSNYQDCGIVSEFTNMAATKMSTPTTLYSLNGWFEYISYEGYSYKTTNTKAVAFETQNGENIIAYYNRNCRTEYLNNEAPTRFGNEFGFPVATICLNLIYDLNGKKGPNTIGKDMGIMTIFNATDSKTVAPVLSSIVNAGSGTGTYSWRDAGQECTKQDPESRIPNIEELSSILINKDIVNLASGYYWSSSNNKATTAWLVETNGVRYVHPKTYTAKVRCVKR